MIPQTVCVCVTTTLGPRGPRRAGHSSDSGGVFIPRERRVLGCLLPQHILTYLLDLLRFNEQSQRKTQRTASAGPLASHHAAMPSTHDWRRAGREWDTAAGGPAARLRRPPSRGAHPGALNVLSWVPSCMRRWAESSNI